MPIAILQVSLLPQAEKTFCPVVFSNHMRHIFTICTLMKSGLVCKITNSSYKRLYQCKAGFFKITDSDITNHQEALSSVSEFFKPLPKQYATLVRKICNRYLLPATFGLV